MVRKKILFERCKVLTNLESPRLGARLSHRSKFYLSCCRILIRPPTMRYAAVIMVVSVAFASQAFAVLRPLFPAKAGPPFGAEAITTGNISVQHSAKQAPATSPR